MIVASHLEGSTTFDEVERFKTQEKAKIHYLRTNPIVGNGNQKAAIAANIRKIKRYMPPA